VPNTLAEAVRQKIHDGSLPVDDPLKVWAGIGSGNPCASCEEPILRVQTEYEVMYYDERPSIRLHVACYGLWEAERHRRRSKGLSY